MEQRESNPLIRIEDYRPPDHLISEVDLDIRLERRSSEVLARLGIKANPKGTAGAPLVLDRDGVCPERILLDGRRLDGAEYNVEEQRIIIPRVPDRAFTLETLSLIDPEANTTLNGLYLTNGIFCTQCEAEGFRRITPFIDRPDVLARYRTRVEATKAEARYLLSNGNPADMGDLAGGRHFAVWDDPWLKPSYLFALVAGNLARVSDHFVTRSGRHIRLDIFVEEGKEDRTAFAMESLKRAMRWDEEAFGREYDLDVFMLVAVSDFNMGAMENKGLNIFNDKYVLADAKRATDSDFINIEAIIGHEYFHNWTGNRITCRDWFQLCVKEGLTVFRDQEFTSAMRSPAVKRILDVSRLKSSQFVEDQGPLAHPVRPRAYREINNFYTATVYEKGAEVIRMLREMIGAAAFAKGMDLYFNRHDGQAVTVEDFIACFAEASGLDLTIFMRWYNQAGTPEIIADMRHDLDSRTLTLSFHQMPAKMAAADALPQPVPVRFALIDRQGNDLVLNEQNGSLAAPMIIVDDTHKSITYHHIDERPVPSLLRGFSAPVKLSIELGDDDLVFLLKHDSDSFNRWQAGQTLAMRCLLGALAKGGDKENGRLDGLVVALASALEDPDIDEAFLSLLLLLPSESDMAREIGENIDPDAILRARRNVRSLLGGRLSPRLMARFRNAPAITPFALDGAATARRALRNALLALLCAPGANDMLDLALRQFGDADNMTAEYGALLALSQHDCRQRETALAAFHDRYAEDALVIDKWFALQAAFAEDSVLSRISALMGHTGFSLTNPNRVRALIATFAFSNPSEFSRADGEGFRFIADQVLALDRINPQVAARLVTAFRSWRALEEGRRQMAHQNIERIAAAPGLSRDVEEMVRRMLG